MDRKYFFDAARELLGGKLTQPQVDKLNNVIDGYQTKGMVTSRTGIDLISSFEDTRLKSYDDGVGIWTIGIGTTIYPNGVKVKKGDTCSLDQAKSYFSHDLKRFENAVNSSLKMIVNQNQFDALVSLAYNIGEDAFKKSTLVEMLNNNNFTGASDQFLRWNKAKGKVLNGLTRRREAERALFLKK